MILYYEDDLVTLYHGDALEAPALAADVLLTDPPYSRAGALHTGRWTASAMASDSAGSDQFWLHWFGAVGQRVLQCVRPTGHGFVFCDYRTIGLVERGIAQSGTGWHVSQGLVWNRQSMGLGTPFRASHELIAFARGPAFKWTGRRDLRNVLDFQWHYGEHPNHPAEKPVGLLGFLIAETCPVDGIVFDPFAGSGSTLVAARGQGRKAVGIEAEERYCEIAARRMTQEVLAV